MTGPLRYLSYEWLVAADQAVCHLEPLEVNLVIGYQVNNHPSQPQFHHHHLTLGPDRVGFGTGLGLATVVLKLDWELACSIARGQVGAQRAFLDGQLTIDGDPAALLGYQTQLAKIDDRLGALRAETRFD